MSASASMHSPRGTHTWTHYTYTHTHSHFFLLIRKKNEKKTSLKQTLKLLPLDRKCSSAEGIIRTGDKETTEIGSNYFVSVFINENEEH